MSRKLDFQMVARLRDRVSGPAKGIREASGGMSKALGETRNELRKVNAQANKTEKLGRYNRTLSENQQELTQTRDKLARLQREFRKSDKPTKTLRKEMESTGKKVGRLSDKQERLRKEAGKVRKELKKEGISTAKLGDEQTRLNQRSQDLNQTLERQRRTAAKLQKVKSGLSSWGQGASRRAGQLARMGMWGGGAAAAGAGALGWQMMRNAGGREDFLVTLETIEGSRDAAREASDWVSEFAATTPYQLAEVREAYTKLRAYGMEPTNGLLRTLGDTSAAMGKNVLDSVEAIADAVTGENERLKEFGIKASTSGDLITYRYTNSDGQEQTAQVLKNDREMIRQTLTRIWRDRFGGAMEARSRTWNGMLSNLRDQWTRFSTEVAGSGPMDELKGDLRDTLDMLNRAAEDGRLERWARDTGQDIKEGIGHAKDFAKWAGETAESLKAAAQGAKELVGSWETLAAVGAGAWILGPTGIIAGLVGAGMTLKWLAGLAAAHPILALITSVAAGAYFLITHWTELREWFSDFFDWMSKKFGALGETAAAAVSPLGFIMDRSEEFGAWLADRDEATRRNVERLSGRGGKRFPEDRPDRRITAATAAALGAITIPTVAPAAAPEPRADAGREAMEMRQSARELTRSTERLRLAARTSPATDRRITAASAAALGAISTPTVVPSGGMGAPVAPQINQTIQAAPGMDEATVGRIAGQEARRALDDAQRQADSRRRGRLVDPE